MVQVQGWTKLPHLWCWYVLCCMYMTIFDGGWCIMSIGTATHPWCENSPCSITINGGNWLHNSCRRQVSHCLCSYFVWYGGCWYQFCSHRSPARHYTWPCGCWGGGGQGPLGGCTLVYMYPYTDQENVTVNHYTHMV